MGYRESARDTATALLVVAAVLGALYLFAGTWPPMVVVESRSMMHPTDDPGYGNLGTADPGDIIFVQNIDSLQDVELAVDRTSQRYGGDGDVVIYWPNGDRSRTPVIHRAITFVEVQGEGDSRQYRVFMGGNEWRVFGSEGVYLPEYGIGEGAGYTRDDGWTPSNSGLITQGDNPETNAHPDQVSSPPISRPVEADWIKGEGRGELPWLGLIKLAFASDLNVNPPPADWVRFGNAYAPADLWIVLFASGLTFVIMPLGYDVYREWNRTEGRKVPPYLSRLRDRFGGSGEPTPEPAAELQPEGADEGGDEGSDETTTFQVVSSGRDE
jgi:signal peptidase